jgi:hypothetical protein
MLGEVGSFDSLAATFNTLDPADGVLDVGEDRFVIDDFLFRHVGVVELHQQLIEDLVAVLSFAQVLIAEEAREFHFQSLHNPLLFHEHRVQVHEIRPNHITLRRVVDDVLG